MRDTHLSVSLHMERIDVTGCLDSALWPNLTTIVLVEPDGGILPVRAFYEEGRDGWQIGVNPLSEEPRW
jgi:hypothetical protein